MPRLVQDRRHTIALIRDVDQPSRQRLHVPQLLQREVRLPLQLGPVCPRNFSQQKQIGRGVLVAHRESQILQPRTVDLATLCSRVQIGRRVLALLRRFGLQVRQPRRLRRHRTKHGSRMNQRPRVVRKLIERLDIKLAEGSHQARPHGPH
jgi:hypothetical protein